MKADTIHISQPLTIHYRLRLVGRVVAVTHPITMNMTSAFLFGLQPVEPWTYSEKHIYIDDQITMRERQFGLVEILDENVEIAFEQGYCQPAVISATTENVSFLINVIQSNLCTRVTLGTLKKCRLFERWMLVKGFPIKLLSILEIMGIMLVVVGRWPLFRGGL